MKSWLLYKDREISSQGAYSFSNDLVKDLNLTLVFKTMAKEDYDIQEAAKKVMIMPLAKEEEILYRQEIIQDVLRCPIEISEIRQIAGEVCTVLNSGNGKTLQPRGKMIEDLKLLERLTDTTIQVRKILRKIENCLESNGLKALIERVEEYDWDAIRENIAAMNFISAGGKLQVSMSLGRGLKLDEIQIENCVGGSVKKSIFHAGKPKEGTFDRLKKFADKMTKSNCVYLEEESLIHDMQMLQEAAMLHILERYESFFHDLKVFYRSLYFELNFYYGCYHLYSRFEELSIPFVMPTIGKRGKQLHFEKLYELPLAIYTRKMPVSNDLTESDKRLYVITGANQGGKTTFLRSIAISQVMMQCGMFVPAEAYTNILYKNILTHFTRREDQQLNSGRLEEEICRMDKMINVADDKCMMLLNESFASTTEKEGSMIAEGITRALYEAGIDVFMVTHLSTFAQNAYKKNLKHAVFLTAERKEDGVRTYKMIEHEPTHTSYGLDLYEQMIGG